MMEDRRAWLISPMTVKHSDLSWEAGGSDLVPGSASQTSSVTTGTHQPLSFLTVSGDLSLPCLDTQNVGLGGVLLR